MSWGTSHSRCPRCSTTPPAVTVVEVLPNGNLVVANWTGHSGRDFRPGWKLIEFTPDGRVVWHWNAEWAGTPNSLIVFDSSEVRK